MSTPASRGLYALFVRLETELKKLEAAVPEEMFRSLQALHGEITDENDDTGILKITRQQDPSRIIYNALIPFLISVLEHFLRESFEILLKYDSLALSKMTELNKKISINEAFALTKDEITLERIISGWYSFQNLQSIQRAFEDAFNISILKTLHRRKKVKNKIPVLLKALENLISTRHGVIHELSLNYQITREEFLELLHLVQAIINVMAEEFEKMLGVKLSAG